MAKFFFLFLFIGAVLAAEDEGLIVLTPEQIADARITTKVAAPVKLKVTATAPAKIVINEKEQAHVVAKAAGVVTQIIKTIGDQVKEGEVLAWVDSKEMAEAKGAYLTALKRYNLAKQNLSTEETLKDKKICSTQDYLQTNLAYQEAQINLDVAVQQLYILGMEEMEVQTLDNTDLKDLRKLALKAPMDGVVITKDLTRGSQISADQEVYTIANLDTVWVELGLYPGDLNRIKKGHKLIVNPIKGDCPPAIATIQWISPTIDEDTKRASCTALLANKEQSWCPGAYVCADIVLEEVKVKQAVVKEAIQEIDGEKYIFVPHAQGFQKRAIEPGRSDSKYVEVISGIQVGEPYAATQTFLLKAEQGKAEAELD